MTTDTTSHSTAGATAATAATAAKTAGDPAEGTAISTTTSTAPGLATRGTAPNNRWRLSFAGVLRSEVTKLFSLRSTYWLLVMMIGGYAALSALMFATSEVGPGRPGAAVFTIGAQPGQLLIVMLGVLAMTGEYATGAIRSTLAAVPRRTPVLAAKAIVVAGVTAGVTLVSIGAAVLASIPWWGQTGTPVFDGQFLHYVAATTGYLVAISVIALALGTLIRASAGGIAAGISMVLIVPMVLTGFLGSQDWARALYRLMPDAQLNALMGSDWLTGSADALAGYQSALVLTGWVVLALGAAAWRLRASDA